MKTFLKKLLPKKLKKRIKKYIISSLGINSSAKNILKNRKNISKPYLIPKKTASFLISTLGCGHSGSGAVLDFLREFDNCTVFGYLDPDGGGKLSKTIKNDTSFEVDFLRHAGGVFELEQAFTYKNIFVQDAAIKRFIALSEYWYSRENIPFYNDEYMRLTRKFIEDISDFKITSKSFPFQFHSMIPYHVEYDNLEAPFFIEDNKDYTLYYLKELTVQEYRKLANRYIMDFFSTIDSKPYLVLDGFIGDATSDFSRKKDYIDNLKVVMVYRDPRDVYVTAADLGCNSWVPADPEDFIKWYKRSTFEVLKPQDDDYLIIRFEDFVFEYDRISQKIMTFLNLKKENHVSPMGFFDPEISSKNIGLYKNFRDQDVITKIEKELSGYCYYF